VIAWILSLGPGAPSGPPEFTAYRELQRLHCRTVFDRVGELNEPARTLYTGAAQACLAAFQGQSGEWSKAERAYDDVAGRTSEFNCMDLAALAALKRLVSAHREDPDGSFAVAGRSEWRAPPCPTITRLEPDHGVQGTTVTIAGQNLTAKNVVGVDVVDSTGGRLPGENLARGGDTVRFTMPEQPPPEAEPTVCVVVRAEPDWSADGAFFRYDTQSPAVSAAQRFACPPNAQ
jgi:hypothetical protein